MYDDISVNMKTNIFVQITFLHYI